MWLVAVLVGACGWPLHGEDDGGSSQAPETPSSSGDEHPVGAGRLRDQLPANVASIVTRLDRVYWDDGRGCSFRILDLDAGVTPLLDTELGPLQVNRRLLEDNRIDALEALPKLLQSAKQAGLQARDLVLSDSQLVGVHLASAEAVILPEGILRRSTAAPDERGDEAGRVVLAVASLLNQLKASPSNELGRQATMALLESLSSSDDHASGDQPSGAFARRLVRGGWLEASGVFPPAAGTAVAALKSALSQAERFTPILAYDGDPSSSGGAMRLAQVHNAFGVSGWILTTPARCVLSRSCPKPAFDRSIPEMNLTVSLQPGSDPLANTITPIGAKLFQNGQRLVSWDQDRGFSAVQDAWRKLVPGHGRVERKAVRSDFMPPAIPVTGLLGDVSGLLVDGGYLATPRSQDPAEVDHFLSNAAAILPDAAHLDLIGEYLFDRVPGSADNRFPQLIGTAQAHGASGQTAEQTIRSATGGIMRGSADDLAELYQDLAERQGRTAHILRMPTFDACAWAEKGEDAQWHLSVLQADTPFEFSDRDLPVALEKACRAFGESDAFDADRLALRLRFPGQAARTPVEMSWRIFAEPDYARLMVDVQKDLYFHTYQRAIAKLQKLIADGDNAAGNFRELARLYGLTGQYEVALATYQKALALASDPVQRLYLSLEQLKVLLEADKLDAARVVAKDILDGQLQAAALKDRLGLSIIQIGDRLAALTSHRLNDIAVQTIQDTMLAQMGDRIVRVGAWVSNERADLDAWNTSAQFHELRRLTRSYAEVAIDVLQHAGEESLPLDSTLVETTKSVQQWLDQIAFHDIDNPGDMQVRYADAGHFYEAMLGQERFTNMLEYAEPPKSRDYKHVARIGGLAQLKLDLPWILISVPYWYDRIHELFDKEHQPLRLSELAAYGKRLEDAYQISTRLGIDDQAIDFDYHLGRLIAALVDQDRDLVRERLRAAQQGGISSLRDETARWIGDAALYLPMPWYKQVVGLWTQEVGDQADFLLISWRAALAGAPTHALYVAGQAASLFKDDPATTEEADYLKKLLTPLVDGSQEAK